jgi:glycine reductase complex component B subunit alpha and beta
MKLTLKEFGVTDVRFDTKTAFSKGVLSICREELVDLLSVDPRLKGVRIDAARPGEKVRITNILEISEPRVKEGTQGRYFPGMLGELYGAGDGTTNVLTGSAVFELGMMAGFYGALMDMAGEGALYAIHAKTHNICLIADPAPGVELVEYGLALKQAGLKTSVYLAKTVDGLNPDRVKVFDMDGDRERGNDLPRVAYLLQLHSHGDSREPFVYGDNSRRYYPTILHPNEILDGAIVCGHYNISVSIKNTTYSLLNHPVILDLYKRHGRDVDFRGVVITPEPTSLKEIRRCAVMSASLLKNVLKADGVIITKEGGGHTDVDIMQNCEECERRGIRTVIIDNEWLGPDGAGELPLLAISHEADAIVSVGNIDDMIDLSPMERIIGGETMLELKQDLTGRLKIPIRFIPNAISQLGFTYLRTEGR